MDPITISATISSLIIAVEQIVVVIYEYGSGVKGAEQEINRLCSELFALKASLEHVRTNLENADDQPGSYSAFYSPLIRTDEFRSTLSTTESLIYDLTRRFERALGYVNAALHSLVWPWRKNDIMEEVQQLERLKSYFILATSTDNL